MKVGDRARGLLKRGVDRYAEAGLAATRVAVTHRHGVPLGVALVAAPVFFISGCLVPDTMLVATHLRSTPSDTEVHNSLTLRAAGIDAEHPLPSDLPVRLALPVQSIKDVEELLHARAEDSSDMAGIVDGYPGQHLVAPAKVAVLRDFLAFLRQQPRIDWPIVFAEIRLQHVLTDRARAILAPLAHVPPGEIGQLGPLLARLLGLTQDQREALYTAGVPPVPTDPERRWIFERLPKASDIQVHTIYAVLNDTNASIILSRTIALLRSPRSRMTRAALGLLADGRRLDARTIAKTPTACNVAVPMSCTETGNGGN